MRPYMSLYVPYMHTQVKRMFGMHVWPWLPTGSVALKSGPLMAGAGSFEVSLYRVCIF